MRSSMSSAWRFPMLFVLITLFASCLFTGAAARPIEKRGPRMDALKAAKQDVHQLFADLHRALLPKNTPELADNEKEQFYRVVTALDSATPKIDSTGKIVGKMDFDPDNFVIGDYFNDDGITGTSAEEMTKQNQGDAYDKVAGVDSRRNPQSKFTRGMMSARSLIADLFKSEASDKTIPAEAKMPSEPSKGFKQWVSAAMEMRAGSKIMKFLVNGDKASRKELKERSKAMQSSEYAKMRIGRQKRFPKLFGPVDPQEEKEVQEISAAAKKAFSASTHQIIVNYKANNPKIFAPASKFKNKIKTTFHTNNVAAVLKINGPEAGVVPPPDFVVAPGGNSDVMTRGPGEIWAVGEDGRGSYLTREPKTKKLIPALSQEALRPFSEMISDSNGGIAYNAESMTAMIDGRVYDENAEEGKKFLDVDPETKKMKVSANQAYPDMDSVRAQWDADDAAAEAAAKQAEKNRKATTRKPVPKAQPKTGPTGETTNDGPGPSEGGKPMEGGHVTSGGTEPGKTAPKGPPKGPPKGGKPVSAPKPIKVGAPPPPSGGKGL